MGIRPAWNATGPVYLVADNAQVFRRAEILALLQSGEFPTQQALARKLGIGKSTLTRYMQREGIMQRKRFE